MEIGVIQWNVLRAEVARASVTKHLNLHWLPIYV